jgi:hypothetical protein
VGTSVAGITVFVGSGTGLVVGFTVTDMSHARVTKMNRERNNKDRFAKVLCIMSLLSSLSILTRKEKLPYRWGSLHCPDGQALR